MINTEQNNLTGIVKVSNNSLVFHSDKYEFTFSPVKIMDYNDYLPIITDGGFLHGTIHGGRKVAIFIGKEYDNININRDVTVHVPLYLKSETAVDNINMREFKSISFYGGVLNELNKQYASIPKYDESNNVIIERIIKEDSYEFKIEDGKCIVSFGVSPYDSWGEYSMEFMNEGFLTLTFERNQSIETIYSHYTNVKRLISVMTNRSENHFDRIVIRPDSDANNRHILMIDVLIKDNDVPLMKKWSKIKFDDIGESVASILCLFYNSKERHPSYSLGFIAKNDNEFYNVTDDRIRSICAALECELYFHNEIVDAQKEELNNLCKKVKGVIKAYRLESDGENALTEGTYNLIYGSIDHWSMSACDKITMLYDKYKEAVNRYNHGFSELHDNDIHDFIKYRNDITHGKYKLMNNRIRRTALLMEVLVFCSLLNRAGVSKEKIEELCEMNIGR